jgi:hypothetical protein
LFVRTGRKAALCRLQANVVRHVAAAKKVDERSLDAGVHQRLGFSHAASAAATVPWKSASALSANCPIAANPAQPVRAS